MRVNHQLILSSGAYPDGVGGVRGGRPGIQGMLEGGVCEKGLSMDHNKSVAAANTEIIVRRRAVLIVMEVWAMCKRDSQCDHDGR